MIMIAARFSILNSMWRAAISSTESMILATPLKLKLSVKWAFKRESISSLPRWIHGSDTSSLSTEPSKTWSITPIQPTSTEKLTFHAQITSSKTKAWSSSNISGHQSWRPRAKLTLLKSMMLLVQIASCYGSTNVFSSPTSRMWRTLKSKSSSRMKMEIPANMLFSLAIVSSTTIPLLRFLSSSRRPYMPMMTSLWDLSSWSTLLDHILVILIWRSFG